METRPQLKRLRTLFGLCAGLLAATAPAAAITLSVLPTQGSVHIGNVAEIQFFISDLFDLQSPSLGSYDFTVAFDASILAFEGAAFGDAVQGNQLDLGGFGTVSGAQAGVGSVTLFEVSLDDVSTLNGQQVGDFVLVTIQFRALQVGSTSLVVNGSSLVLSDASGNPLTAQLMPGAISAVPEPASLLMLLAGLTPFLRRLASTCPERATP